MPAILFVERRPRNWPGIIYALLRFYARVLNLTILMMSAPCFINAFQIDMWGGMGITDVGRYWLGWILMPFGEGIGEYLLPSEADVQAKVVATTMGMGIMCFTLSVFGTAAMSCGRPDKHWRVLMPYVLLVSILLMWMLDWRKAVGQVMDYEDILNMKALQASSDDSRFIRHKVFVEGMYKKYLELYGHFGCTTVREKSSNSLRLSCEADSLEGTLFQYVIELMMAPHALMSKEDIADFGVRSEMFCTQGLDWGLLPKPLRPQDEVFCRCRVSGHIILSEIKDHITLTWLALMMGACLILYFGVEHRFLLMDSRQRRDALGFLTFGAFSLSVRSLLFQ